MMSMNGHHREWFGLPRTLCGCLLAGFFSLGVHAQDLLTWHEAALVADPQWLAAQHAWDAAQQRPGLARADLLPQLKIVASRHDQRGDLRFSDESPVNKDVSSKNQALQLTQGLVRPEQWMALRQAHAQEKQAGIRYQSERQQLSVRLTQAYLDAWVAQESLRLLDIQMRANEAQLGMAKRNFAVGSSTITDVHEAQAQRDLGQAQIIETEQLLQTHLLELQRLTGLVPSTLYGIREDAPMFQEQLGPIEVWLDKAISQQPELLMAQAAVDVAEREIDRQGAKLLPTLDLTLMKARDSSSGSVSAPADVPYRTDTGQALLTLNWPIFEGGRSFYQVREAYFSLAKAKSESDLAHGRATTQVRQAYAGVLTARAKIHALISARKSSELALEASQVGYRIGTRINLDVLNAQSQYANVQRDLARARADFVLQWIKLQASAGQLNLESIRVINQWLVVKGDALSERTASTSIKDHDQETP